MPRSGSTLLQNILAQNPDFYVTPTSGVLELLHGARVNFSAAPEFKAQNYNVVSKGFVNFCYNGLIGYYSSITDKKYVVDKSRGWAINFNFLKEIYPNPKIICMVRDLRSILASFERIDQKNSLLNSKNCDNLNLKNTTILKRAESRLNSAPVGLSVNRMYDILNQSYKNQILFVKYENFIKEPDLLMKKIYNFLNINSYEHNFENIQQTTLEDDEVYGIRNLHTIKNKIENNENYFLEVLGEEFCNKIYFSFKWFFEYFEYER